MSAASRVIPSPLGPLYVAAESGSIVRLSFSPVDAPEGDEPALDQLAAELDAYFAGERLDFSVPLAPRGTPFQQRVWGELLKIPPGETRAYLTIARALGDPNATRAVGAANGANPIAIVIPCHRVVRTGGALGGFGGGLDRKRWLLDHEAQLASARLFG